MTVETQIWAHLAQADGTESEGLLVCLLELAGAIHQALVGLTVSNAEHMWQLMARRLHCTILHLSSDFGGELSHGSLAKIGVVSGVALNTDSPALLGHAKDEGPAFLRVQISIRQNQKALILLKTNIFLQVVEQLPSMKLSHSSVRPDPGLYDFLLVKPAKIRLHLLFAGVVVLLDADGCHTSEEDFENWFHIINKHFLKISFLGR